MPLSGSINIVSLGKDNLSLKPEYGSVALNSRFTTIRLADGRSASALATELIAGAGKLDLAPTPGDGGSDNSVLTPYSARSLLANVRHKFGHGIEGYADLVHLETEGNAVLFGTSSISISGDDNPFQQPIAINLPVPTAREFLQSKAVTNRVTVGLLVNLPRDWKANVDYAFGSGIQSGELRFAGYAGYSALALGIYAPRPLHPLGDISTLLAGLASYPGDYVIKYRSVNLFRDGSIRLAGPLVQLSGGPVTATLLAEDRREYVPTRPVFVDDIGVKLEIPNPEVTEQVRSYYGELRMPLLDERRSSSLLRGLELQLAMRNDTATLRAADQIINLDYTKSFVEVRRSTTMYTAGFRVRPMRGLMFRASVATGSLPLTANQVGTIVNTNQLSYYADPKRGNQAAGQDEMFTILSEGSYRIIPERARSLSFGFVITPMYDTGLRLSLDYTRIDKRNEIVNTYGGDPAYFLAHESDYPGRVTRLSLTPEDAALGYTGGIVTQIDTTYLNIGRTRIEAVDATIDYLWRTAGAGDFSIHAAVSWQPRYDRTLGPGFSTLSYVSTSDGALRWRGNGAIGWSKDGLGVILSGQYYGSYSVARGGYDTENVSLVLDQGAPRVRAQAVFDLALSYRFDMQWVAGRTRSLDLRLGVQDLLDRSAPIVTNTEGGYSYYADPRRRRFELTVAVGI